MGCEVRPCLGNCLSWTWTRMWAGRRQWPPRYRRGVAPRGLIPSSNPAAALEMDGPSLGRTGWILERVTLHSPRRNLLAATSLASRSLPYPRHIARLRRSLVALRSLPRPFRLFASAVRRSLRRSYCLLDGIAAFRSFLLATLGTFRTARYTLYRRRQCTVLLLIIGPLARRCTLSAHSPSLASPVLALTPVPCTWRPISPRQARRSIGTI